MWRSGADAMIFALRNIEQTRCQIKLTAGLSTAWTKQQKNRSQSLPLRARIATHSFKDSLPRQGICFNSFLTNLYRFFHGREENTERNRSGFRPK